MDQPQPLGPGTTPGPEATLPERRAVAAPPGSQIPSHYGLCFVCGTDHPAGLRLRIEAGEGLTARASFEVGQWHQGAPGIAHGGVLISALDETLGLLNWIIGKPAVTAHLETAFLRPVPVGSRVVLDAAVTGVSGRKIYSAAVGRLGEDGPVVVKASGLFIQVQPAHFREHGRAEDVVAAREARLLQGGVP